MLPNLIDSRRTEWTLIRMLASPRKVERKWCVPLWIAACPTPRLRANSIQPRRPSANGVGRFCAEGVDGLRDRSSRPLSSPRQIPLATADAVENLRRERRTQEHIA